MSQESRSAGGRIPWLVAAWVVLSALAVYRLAVGTGVDPRPSLFLFAAGVFPAAWAGWLSWRYRAELPRLRLVLGFVPAAVLLLTVLGLNVAVMVVSTAGG